MPKPPFGAGVDVHLDPVAFESLEADAEALLAEWTVQPGDVVQAGQEIGVAELVKASVPVTAPIAGQVQALYVPAGESFGRGAVLARLLTGITVGLKGLTEHGESKLFEKPHA